MSRLRKYKFLILSISLHVLAVVIIILFANPVDQVYENIEVTSYVATMPKPTSSRIAKTKNEKTNHIADKSKELTSDAKFSDSNVNHDNIGEELSNESAITSPAVLLIKIKANRTEAARRADYSGISQVELVVGSDGLVRSAKLRNSLPYGLDDVALNLARESKFKPAMIDNKPVASAILFKVRFEAEK